MVEEKFRLRLASATDGIREHPSIIGEYDDGRKPYASPTSGTTTTSIPNEFGRFEEPVYYDWGCKLGPSRGTCRVKRSATGPNEMCGHRF